MINQPLPPNMNREKQIEFGMRLASYRENLGLDVKEAAVQLRLPEKIIMMMESGEFEADLPLMFLRGYLRNYSKLLAIPEDEVREALETLSPRAETVKDESNAGGHVFFSSLPIAMKLSSLRLHHFFMQSLKYLIGLSLIGLICVSLFTHKTTSHQENTITQTPLDKTAAPEINLSQKTPPPAQELQKKSAAVFSFPKLSLFQILSGLIFISLTVLSGTYIYRNYYAKKTRPVSRTRRISRRQPNLFIKPNLLFKVIYAFNHHFYNKKIMFIAAGVFAVLLGLFGINKLWHYPSHRTPVVMTTPKPAPDKLTMMLSPFNVYAGIEKLAPAYNIYDALSSGKKTYPLFAFSNQLTAYMNYAEAVKFALTDPSTPIGQIPFVKKPRKYRRVYNQIRKPDIIPAYYRYNE